MRAAVLSLAIVLGSIGCQEESAETTLAPDSVESGVCGEDLPEMTWQSFGDGFVATYCQGCHASGTFDRHGAPASVVFDTEADVLSRRDAVARTVLGDAPSMPPGGGVTAEQRELLAAYLKCAGP